MNSRPIPRIFALLLLCAWLLVLAACGGGGSTTTGPVDPGDIDQGGNGIPPIDIDGPTGYTGKPKPQPGGTPGSVQDVPGTWDFGASILRLPVDSQGTSRIVAESFSPGQKVAFVLVNMNPQYLDAHATGQSGFPNLPESSYTVQASLVDKGVASASGGAQLSTIDDISTAYSGLPYTGKPQDPSVIYEREARAQGLVPYAAIPAKGTSAISKGEIRTFTNVEPRDIALPPIEPGEDNPDRDTSEFEYPQAYNSQDGRLVAIGQHCLIFLSTEINNGHPDNIRFTQSRLNRMAQEFDTKIFPIATASFGPVVSYGEGSVLRDVDRNIPPLTGDDFGDDGELLVELPGQPDERLIDEQKILIFIFNGEEGGFFTFGPAQDEEGRDKEVGSTIYLGSDNFPSNDSDFNAAFSVMAHEFQHKLYSDNGLPLRQTSYGWFNEGLSMLSMHLCGYTPNSGKIIHWAIDSQVVTYLQNVNQAAVPMDANQFFSNQAQYGSGFLFFLYMYEHYDPGVGQRIYAASRAGERDPIKLVEAGAQITTTNPGADGQLGTVDDFTQRSHDTFEQVYAKFAIANFVDGLYADNEGLFDQRFRYATIDLRGTVNLSSGNIQLPGVKTAVFPENGTYPVTSNDRLVYPWAADYLVFGSGDGRDLEVLFNADRSFRIFMLPVEVPRDLNGNPISANKVEVVEGANIPY